jgi:hypothetical protein
MAEVGIATIAPPLLPFVLINYKSALIMANKVIDEGALASSRFSISFETFVPQMPSSSRDTTRLGICELRPH